jgi:hypothetical protein
MLRFAITPTWTLRLLLAIAVSAYCSAQVAVSLAPGSGSPGSTVVLNLSVNSTSGNQPASVGWTISYSATDFSSVNVAAGAAATAASKSISCNNSAGSQKCIAWGVNSNVISNGVLATVSMKISGSTKNTSSAVSLSNGLSALPNSTSVATSTTSTVVTIVQSQGLVISGTISPAANGSGATVTLSGAASATTTADASGNYSFGGLANGTYTVTPNKSGFTFSPASAPVNLSGASLFAINFTASAGGPSSALAVNYGSLNFGWSGALITSPQTVAVNLSPASAVAWTATSSQPNITVNPPSGVGSGALQISVNPGPSGVVTVTATGATNSPQQIQVNVNNVTPGLPSGSFDTPLNNTTGIAGAIPVTGWVLDNIEITSVGIWREPIGGETTGTNGLAFIGNATLVPGARPDVQTSYPNSPWNYRAGWGYMLLTNFLPNPGGPLGNGTFRLHAVAVNKAGTQLDLGTRVITVDNGHASKPFGTIDTPDQGGTVSGNAFVNFGWALTQNPYLIPLDGSTIQVLVDGVMVGHPTYNQYRADIANLFPGLANSNGAVGFFTIDTTTLANGMHTIAWVVADNGGRQDGVGSRFFSVLNSGVGGTAAPAESEPAVSMEEAENKIPRVNGQMASLATHNDGTVSLEVDELSRIELPLQATSGYLLVGDQPNALPIGSTLQNGTFYWQLGPSFLGDYTVVFQRGDGTHARVRLRVYPKPRNMNPSAQ